MKLCQRIAPLLLLSSILYFPVFSQTPDTYSQIPRAGNNYFQGSVEQMRQQAKSLQKPYIMFFYADWSDPSKEVERNCIQNSQIQDLIKREFLLYKVEMNSPYKRPATNQLARQYQVSLYPTFIFFAPDGHILKKMAGQLNVQSLGEELVNVREMALDREESETDGTLGEKEIDWLPDDFFAEKEEDIVDEGKTTPMPIVITDEGKAKKQEVVQKAETKPEPVEETYEEINDEEEINWEDPEKIPDLVEKKESVVEKAKEKDEEPILFSNGMVKEDLSQSYGIQLGAYTQRVYAQKKMNQIKRDSDFPVTVVENIVNGTRYFKVILGPYQSEATAQAQRRAVVQELGESQSFVLLMPR